MMTETGSLASRGRESIGIGEISSFLRSKGRQRKVVRDLKIEGRKGEILTSAPSANPHPSFSLYILPAIFLQTSYREITCLHTCLACDCFARRIGFLSRDNPSVSPLQKTVSLSLIVQFAMRQCLPL
jgi:hypothetical protein